MKKEITICFRTNEELRSALEVVAREDRRSLSSAIELILTDYLKKNREFPDRGQQEKRRYPRKQVALPAYIKKCESETMQQHGAVILDMSLGGLYMSVPKECVSAIYEGGDSSEFETTFVLPEGQKSVRVVCKAERVVPSNGTAFIGASFVDADFVNYQKVQHYLV
jgi:hypothetical protein